MRPVLVTAPRFWHLFRARAPPRDAGGIDMKAAITAGVLALAALCAPAGVQAADLADVKARGVLRVVVMPLNPRDEFFAYPPGARPGFDREVLDAFARLHRITLEVIPIEGWDNLIPAL